VVSTASAEKIGDCPPCQHLDRQREVLDAERESWCLEVTEEEFRRLFGDATWQEEKEYRQEMYDEGFPALAPKWRFYPSLSLRSG